MYEKIPSELKQLKQWCTYRLEWDKEAEKYKKIPLNAYTGSYGKSNDESTWADFDTALAAKKKYDCDGLGFYFKPPYFGVDIDQVSEEIYEYIGGYHENLVGDFIDRLGSYTEISISGTGIHIIGKGTLPEGGRRKDKVEMYSEGRFFVMTGKQLGPYKEIRESQEAITYLHSQYIGGGKVTTDRKVHATVHLSNSEILERAFVSKQGPVFRMLYQGYWGTLYPSQSEADLSFANMLAFWTGADFGRMDEIFRTSGLMREKWDRKTGSGTYGERVLNKAISNCQEVYSGNRSKSHRHDNEASRKEYALDDTGNAERFIDSFGEYLRYSYINRCWYFYDGKAWVQDQTGEIKQLADKLVEEMKKELAGIEDSNGAKAFMRHLKKTRDNTGKSNMIKESEHRVSILPYEFDRYKDLFNCQNGYVNLREGALHEHKAEKYFTKISNAAYTNESACPLWLEFLDEIFDHDQELIDYLQKAVEYSLTGSTREQCMFVVFGNGRNGKSVFLDIITAIMGNYAANIQPQTIIVKPHYTGTSGDIARLKAARFVTTTELNDGVRLDEGLVKQLTGGDKITARHLYKDEFEYEPEFKLWMATNHKPIIRGRDDGIWRRLHFIPFHVQIPEHKVDKNLRYKLKQELDGILNWAVEGCLKWQREGLQKPKAVEHAGSEYKVEMDIIAMFIEECCEVGEGKRMKAKLLYETYREWAKDNGQYVMSSTKFGREVAQKFEKQKSSEIYYSGVDLNAEYRKLPMNL